MRVLIALAALTGCTTMAEPPMPTGPCGVSEPLRMRFVGTKYRMEMRDEMQALSNSRVARVLRPGDVATMDLREDRLNIEVDDGGQVSGLRCG